MVAKVSGGEDVYSGMAQFPAGVKEMAPEAIQGAFTRFDASPAMRSTDFASFKKKKSLADCIKTNEFMHVYNAIIVLKEILPVFPLSAVIDLTGPPLNQVIETFIEKEERGDLKILARAYVARQFLVGVPHLITNRPVITLVSKSGNTSGLPQMCWLR